MAVPGLGADPKLSWIKRRRIDSKMGEEKDNRKADAPRFKDGPSCIEDKSMLQAEVPNSRIMIFQYVSQWWGAAATSQSIDVVADNLLQYLKNHRKVCVSEK